MFNKFDFLAQDDAGAYYWVDDFLFSVDTSGTLASNREAMWQEIRLNYQTGAFGNVNELDTQILFWSLMASQGYPMAAEVKSQLEEKQQQQQMMQQQQQLQQMQQVQGGGANEMPVL